MINKQQATRVRMPLQAFVRLLEQLSNESRVLIEDAEQRRVWETLFTSPSAFGCWLQEQMPDVERWQEKPMNAHNEKERREMLIDHRRGCGVAVEPEQWSVQVAGEVNLWEEIQQRYRVWNTLECFTIYQEQGERDRCEGKNAHDSRDV